MIVGCGNIAGGLDSSRVASVSLPITHAKAYKMDEYFDLVACVDPDLQKRLKFQKDWSLDYGFSSIQELRSIPFSVDVISICSPTHLHTEHLEVALSLNPKLVFCEKPLGSDIEVLKEILDRYKKQGIHLAVNYSRRFDNSVINFKSSIDSGEYGILRGINGWYGKGLLNNGSHMLDLLIYLLGNVNIKYVGDACYDFSEEDPSYPLFLITDNEISIALSCGNSNDFSLFELEFIFSTARIKMLNGGRNWSIEHVITDQTFAGYKHLGPATVSEGGLIHSFQNALNNIHDCLSDDVDLKSTGVDALNVVNLYSDITKMAKARVRA